MRVAGTLQDRCRKATHTTKDDKRRLATTTTDTEANQVTGKCKIDSKPNIKLLYLVSSSSAPSAKHKSSHGPSFSRVAFLNLSPNNESKRRYECIIILRLLHTHTSSPSNIAGNWYL